MNKLEFINHSCVIISNKNTSIAMDPWVEGSVFNNSWNLLVKTPDYLIERLKKVDYVWFSHEHPDHFNPSNLKIFSNDTKFLFQKTKDRRVVNFLSKISNHVKELNYKENFYLNKSFSIQIIPFQYLDSMCIIKLNNLTILNLNDCDIKNEKQLHMIKNLCGPIDLLMVQFSYAIGKSNRENTNEREKWSSDILKKLSKTINFLQPVNVIPFASFCYFSRLDNFYMNDSINKIGPTIDYLKKNNPNINFLSLYPGDIWDFNSVFNNKESINKYETHYQNISPIKIKKIEVEFPKLQLVANEFIKNTKKNNNLFLFYNYLNKKYNKIFFYITDSNIKCEFNFKHGLTEIPGFDYSKPYCSLSSESLYQLFKSGYGYDALVIGGRFEANTTGLKNLNKIFKFQAKNYQNIYYNYQDIFSNLTNKFSYKSILFYKRNF